MQQQTVAEIQSDIQRALALQGSGQLPEAESVYRNLVDNHPDTPDLTHLLGGVLIQQKRHSEAIVYLEQSYRSNPAHPHYSMLYAAALEAIGEVDKSLNVLVTAFQLDSRNTNAFKTLVKLANSHEKFEFLERFLGTLMGRASESPDLRWLLADAKFQQDKFDEALIDLEFVLKSNVNKTPNMYKYYNRCVHASFKPQDLDKALEIVKQGYELFPESKDCIGALSMMYGAMGRHDLAAELRRNVSKENGAHPHSVFCVAIHELQHSSLANGFDEYQQRLNAEDYLEWNLFVPAPEWKGESLDGKKILIYSEQGVGDIIMWGSMLNYLIEQNADVHLAVYPKILELMKRSFPNINVFERKIVLSDKILAENYDYHCPMGNLTQYILPHYKPYVNGAYISVDAEKVAQKRKEYLSQTQDPENTKLIGIAWHTIASTGFRRSIPLHFWDEVFQEPNTTFVSLQYDKREDEVGAINEKYPNKIIFDGSFNPQEDLDDWAIQIAAMDEVITIQNSTAHVAGALGVPTTLMLSSFGCWRWASETGKNYWYDSVNVYRQKPGQPWQEVVDQVAKDRSERG